MPFRTRCRIWVVLHSSGRYITSCERHGRIGRRRGGSAVYADYIAAIHLGNHPS